MTTLAALKSPPRKQTLEIPGWLPPPVLNGSRQLHWSVLKRRADSTKLMAWTAARQAGWTRVPGRVRLTVTFVFTVNRRRDVDNMYARCKHLIDGLKGEFFADDSMDIMELTVKTEVQPGLKATRIELESLA